MNMKMKILSWICCCSLLFGGCNHWLDVEPYDQISENELTKSQEGFQKLLNGIYIELNKEELYGSTLTVEMIEIMGGAYEIGSDAKVWKNYSDLKDYTYGTDYWRDRLDKTWDKAYALILNCNKLLANMEKKKNLFTGINYDIIRGEALALRAMLHFDMFRLFGPVYSRDKEMVCIPYYTAETLNPEELLPASEVVAKVLADLKEARLLLKEDPVITGGTMMDEASDGGTNFLRYRALRLNYYAVTGLLARVALYAGERERAYSYSTEVIKAANDGIFPFVDRKLVIGSPDDPDRIFSSEILFALSHTSRGQLFLNYFDPSRTTFVFKMEKDLIDKRIFGGTEYGGNQDDYRHINWVASNSASFFYKYANMQESGKIQNTMIPMLRLGEMYLIAAESQSADLNAGIGWVNTLRKNRGVRNLSVLTPELLQYEYIRELYGEGQLFFMYKRMYAPVIWSDDEKKNVQPGNAVFVLPLPDTEKDNR